MLTKDVNEWICKNEHWSAKHWRRCICDLQGFLQRNREPQPSLWQHRALVDFRQEKIPFSSTEHRAVQSQWMLQKVLCRRTWGRITSPTQLLYELEISRHKRKRSFTNRARVACCRKNKPKHMRYNIKSFKFWRWIKRRVMHTPANHMQHTVSLKIVKFPHKHLSEGPTASLGHRTQRWWKHQMRDTWKEQLSCTASTTLGHGKIGGHDALSTDLCALQIFSGIGCPQKSGTLSALQSSHDAVRYE